MENINIDYVLKFSEDFLILQELYNQNKEIDVYLWHEKYSLSPAALSRSIKKLEELNYVYSFNGKGNTFVLLTDSGKEFINNNKEKIFSYKEDESTTKNKKS